MSEIFLNVLEILIKIVWPGCAILSLIGVGYYGGKAIEGKKSEVNDSNYTFYNRLLQLNLI